MHTSEKCRRGKQQISHRESERKRARERERGRGRREGERDALGLTIFNTHFLLFCVNNEAITGEGEKRISGNTNMMPRKNKGDGPIVVLSDGC